MKSKAKSPFADYTGKALARKAGTAFDPTAPIREITVALFGYLKTREQERTRREEIAAEERKAIACIERQRDIICKALDRSFDERAKIFDDLLRKLDKVLYQGKPAEVAALTASLTQIAKENPFANIGQILAAQAPDSDYVIEV